MTPCFVQWLHHFLSHVVYAAAFMPYTSPLDTEEPHYATIETMQQATDYILANQFTDPEEDPLGKQQPSANPTYLTVISPWDWSMHTQSCCFTSQWTVTLLATQQLTCHSAFIFIPPVACIILIQLQVIYLIFTCKTIVFSSGQSNITVLTLHNNYAFDIHN